MGIIKYVHPITEPVDIPALQGALCHDPEGPYWSSFCDHDSCQWIGMGNRIYLAIGPICGTADHQGECGHESCDSIEPAQGECVEHGWQLVTEFGAGSGFAGGVIYWATLQCGHTDMDESDDLRAAR